VRWNMNKGSERWLCYGGAAGIIRCQRIWRRAQSGMLLEKQGPVTQIVVLWYYSTLFFYSTFDRVTEGGWLSCA
jgi:hypothetical protein